MTSKDVVMGDETVSNHGASTSMQANDATVRSFLKFVGSLPTTKTTKMNMEANYRQQRNRINEVILGSQNSEGAHAKEAIEKEKSYQRCEQKGVNPPPMTRM